MEKIRLHSEVPVFQLQSVDGRMIGPQDFREKENTVIVFFDINCDHCIDFLSALADRYDDYKELETEILAIVEGPADQIRQIAQSKGIPFPVLIDADSHVKNTYTETIPAVFVADRYAEVRYAIVQEEFPDQQQILDQLSLAELECPECGVPTWVA